MYAFLFEHKMVLFTLDHSNSVIKRLPVLCVSRQSNGQVIMLGGSWGPNFGIRPVNSNSWKLEEIERLLNLYHSLGR